MEQVADETIRLIPVTPFHMEHPHCGILRTSRDSDRINILITPKGRLRERLDAEGRILSWFVQRPAQLAALRAWLQDIQLLSNPWSPPEAPAVGFVDMDPYRRSLFLARLVDPTLFIQLQTQRPRPWLDCRAEAKRIQTEAMGLAMETGLLRCMEGEWYRGDQKISPPHLEQLENKR
ncbi:MAG: hypothetical protein ACOX17_07385 [Christensenellales bacterium]|jgi:hypothetical protein